MGTKNKGKKNVAQKDFPNADEKISAMNVPDVDIAGEAGTSNACIAELIKKDEQPMKTYRKRKRHYYNALRTQMEFYFGDANLSKDRFLKQHVDKDPYVPLEIFMTFNKMKALTSKVEDIAVALSNSEFLEMDESRQKVKRKIPLPQNRNVDEKTLYVEALPSTADHEWVRQIFERFGKVAYISLPKYSKSHKIKEFGFVEFEKEESVNKAIKAFKEFNGVLNMQDKDPADLVSVTSYIKEQSHEKEEHEELRKRSHNEIYEEGSEPKAKLSKTDPQHVSETSSIENYATSNPDSENNLEDDGKNELEDVTNKKKRKRKKKSKTAEKLKRKAELTTDVAYYELKVLPKKDWKRLRNKYLNLQREKVAELKRKAWHNQQVVKQRKDSGTLEENCSVTASQQEKQKPGTKQKLQKMNMNFYGAAEEEAASKGSITERITHQNTSLGRTPLFNYEPGLIVEISFIEPCINIKEFKSDMRQYSSVKYVDIKEGSMQAYLRLESSDKAMEFVHQINCAEYQCKILSDEMERNYWKKIENDREQKLSKQIKVPQKRGRERVKKLITKHIRFGDDDE